MDIFEEALFSLGVEVHFNHDNCFSCQLIEENQDKGFYLTAYRDFQEMSLRIAVIGVNDIQDQINHVFWSELAQAALAPLRGGVGVGIFENTNKISVYQVIKLAGQPKDYVMQVIEKLVSTAQEWDNKITSFKSI